MVFACSRSRTEKRWSSGPEIKRDWTNVFPRWQKQSRNYPSKAAAIDGEVCALNAQGRSSFQLLQNSAETSHPIVYYVFDLLFEGTKDLRSLPLTERKAKLEAILLNAVNPIRPSSFFTEGPHKILDKMRSVRAEGSIAKRRDSVYETGRRSGAWVKIKFHRGQEFVIAGYTLPKKSRRYFGSLILGYHRRQATDLRGTSRHGLQ